MRRIQRTRLPHREQSNIDAVVLQLQFDFGYMGDGGALQRACFLFGMNTSSGAIFTTKVRDPMKMDMDMAHVVVGTSKRACDLGYERIRS